MTQPLDGACNWNAAQLAANTQWIHRFTAAELEEIDAALRHALGKGLTLATLTAEDFPLPNVSKALEQGREQLENGVGLQLYRGIDVHRYDKSQLRLLFWGLGKHMGTAVSQSSKGDVIGDVRDLGTDINSPTGRGYTTNLKLGCHSDSSDVITLFCVRTAKTGGSNLIASSVAVHNEMLRLRPDLVEVMYQPFYWSWQSQELPGLLPYYPQPIFTSYRGKFACRYIRTHIRSAQRFDEVPRLTDKQNEAIDLFDKLTQDPQFALTTRMETGDWILFNNHVALHARTAFEDHDEPDQKRHLMRLWLSMPNSRDLNPAMGWVYRNLQGGSVRGGFPAHGGKVLYETPRGEALLD
jgi:hypothetical protein